jgi:hypothetical protein
MQLDEQVGAPAVLEQSAVGAMHACPQPPQFAGRVMFVSQPSSARVEQCANPATQALGGTVQTPLLQVMLVAPDLMFDSIAQSCPQAPQLAGSESRFTHLDPQRLGSDPTQLDEQAGVPEVLEQSAVGAVHVVPQAPQLSGRLRSVSQPSSGLLEQWPRPEVQADGGM